MDLNYLFNNIPLYTKRSFKIYEYNAEKEKYCLNKEELDLLVKYLGLNEIKLITFCTKCKHEFSFDVNKELTDSLFPYDIPLTNTVCIQNFSLHHMTININTASMNKKYDEIDKESLIKYISYLNYTFTCNNNKDHIYKMYVLIEANDGIFTIRKIGQNPSMITVKGYEFDKYKKQLIRIDAYDEYKKADLCFNEKFNVGAFAYLRRVFEKILNELCKNMEVEDDHVDTKIDAVKEFFDPEIRGLLKNLYSVVSASIHAISEAESEEYYEELKAIIDIQLEYMKTEEDRKRQIQNSQKTLSRIISKYGKK